MAKLGELKDLEASILGLVAECQPCSPYFVHRTFLDSPSLFFSGSAGAIYPAVKRLQQRGFLQATKSGTRGKPSKSLTVTALGRKEYLKWFFDPVRAGDGGFDPMRGRMSLVGGLPANLQGRVMEDFIVFCEKRLALIGKLLGRDFEETGMPRALEMEQATLKAKLELLRSWRGDKV